jgi:3D-(3,5/4)-trihydroxycyclohexane-1,2-dione acylhydrolase (decyclizing)
VRERLPTYRAHNEQAMALAAVAFAKQQRRRRMMACTTSIGPGATNMVTGAATATVNRVPVLLLPGDIFANRLPAPVLQQLEWPQTMDASVNDAFLPVSRYWDRINRPEQLLPALPEAMRVLSDPATTGAVTLCLPQDVQAEAYDFPDHFFEKRTYRVARTRPDRDALAEAARLLRAAQRPLVIAGGGVFYSEAEAALAGLAEACGLPVAVTQAGKGTLSERHPLGLGGVGSSGSQAANRIARQADLVLLLGTRLSDFTSASKTQFQDPAVRFVAVNVNAHDAHKHGSLPLVADCRATLEELPAALAGFQVAEAWQREIAAARQEWDTTRHGLVRPERAPGAPLSQAEVIGILNEQLDTTATIVHAAGGLPGDLLKLWRSRAPGDYHSEYGYSCMGYEVAGAVGVRLAQPEREVYAVVGDGSYLMLNHEIVTSIQEGVKVTVVLLDNQGYQCIHGLQRSCGGRSFGNEFRARGSASKRLDGDVVAVDFVANARSLGAAAFAARDEAELVRALAQARAETRTCLVYVPIDPAAGLPGFSWWDVPVAEVSAQPGAQAARRAYEDGLARRRFYY